MIHLRDCPMCKAPPSDDLDGGPVIRSENMIDPDTGADLGALSYTVLCIDCGASVSAEDLDEAVRLWNGEPKPEDEE